MRKTWSPDEDEILQSMFPIEQPARILLELPGRTWIACQSRAKKLKLTRRKVDNADAPRLIERIQLQIDRKCVSKSEKGVW